MFKTSRAAYPTRICLIGILCLLLWTGCGDSGGQDAVTPDKAPMADRSADRIVAHLYFSDSDNSFLISEERSLPALVRPEEAGALIVKALLEGPKKALERTIPAGTQLKGFYILENRTAYVDLSMEIRDRHPGGAKSELMTIYSIVNSLIVNIPEIETVKLLIEGNEQTSLVGHIDLRYPLRANMLYVR